MVALEVVVGVGLPVARQGPHHLVGVFELLHRELLALADEAPQRLDKGRCRRVEIDPDQIAPRLDPNREQGRSGALHLSAEVAGAAQRTLPVVRPAVVTAHQVARGAVALPQDGSGAMGTHVVESSQRPIGPHHDEQGPASDRGGDVTSRPIEPGQRGEHLPTPPPHRGSFLLMNRRIAIPGSGEGAGHGGRLPGARDPGGAKKAKRS